MGFYPDWLQDGVIEFFEGLYGAETNPKARERLFADPWWFEEPSQASKKNILQAGRSLPDYSPEGMYYNTPGNTRPDPIVEAPGIIFPDFDEVVAVERRKSSLSRIQKLSGWTSGSHSLTDTNYSIIDIFTDMYTQISGIWPAEDDTKLECLSYNSCLHFYSTTTPFIIIPFINYGKSAVTITETESTENVARSLIDAKISGGLNKQKLFVPIPCNRPRLIDVGGSLTRVFEGYIQLDVTKYANMQIKEILNNEGDADEINQYHLCYAVVAKTASGARTVYYSRGSDHSYITKSR